MIIVDMCVWGRRLATERGPALRSQRAGTWICNRRMPTLSSFPLSLLDLDLGLELGGDNIVEEDDRRPWHNRHCELHRRSKAFSLDARPFIGGSSILPLPCLAPSHWAVREIMEATLIQQPLTSPSL